MRLSLQSYYQVIQERCEILHNVQVAKTQAEKASGQQLLNGVVLFLTAFTFLSVFAGSYTFLEGSEHWLPPLLHRLVVLGSLAVLIVSSVWLVFKRSVRTTLGRRGNT
jgi:hypothetical protein